MLEKKIAENLKEALKAGDKVKVSVLRMLISSINNKKIEARVKEMDDDNVLGAIQKTVKQHKESIEKFKEGGREDLVVKESAEMAILEEYLPEPVSAEELAKIVAESIAATGAASPADMGKVMNDVMSKVKGRADGKLIGGMVKEKLAGL